MVAVAATTVPTGTILIVAPHPDDDVLIAAGIAAVSDDVTVAYLTNGESCEVLHSGNEDYCGVAVPNIAQIRQDEAVAAQTTYLGQVENDLIFFGYPNRGLSTMLNSPATPYTSLTGRTETFASRGLGSTDYHDYKHSSHATYTGNNFIGDMTTLIDDLRPDDIFTTGMFDRHTDHSSAYRVVVEAVESVNGSDPTYHPTLHSTIVHVMPQAYWGYWPAAVAPTQDHTPVPELDETTGGTLMWSGRESFVVPADMQKTNLSQNDKYQAIETHASQILLDTWVRRFTRRDEIFWPETLPNSTTPAQGVNDTYLDLVAQGGQATVAAIGVLANDTPGNLATAMTATKTSDPTNGSVTFSADGSFTYTHNGTMTGTDSFTYKPMQDSLLGAEATVNITITLPNQPPVADAGGPYEAVAGTETVFDGSGSSDPNGTIASYDWDFGDGGTGTGMNPTHTYLTSGTFNVELTVTDDEDADDDDTTSTEVSEPPEPVVNHTTGLVDPFAGKWYLYDDAGNLTTSFFYGNPGDFPFMGDWDGDGVETPGMYRQADGYVYLRNSNTVGVADIRFFFGNPGDVPIAGDFNHDGFDTVSIYRPSNQTFYIINELGENDGGLGAADVDYVFGNPGDKPFVGDFDGDGVETVGLHRESTGLVYFRNSHSQGNADAQFIFGDPGDRLVAGDWTGDAVFSPALYRPSNRTMYFKHDNTQGNADSQFVPNPNGLFWLHVSGYRE